MNLSKQTISVEKTISTALNYNVPAAKLLRLDLWVSELIVSADNIFITTSDLFSQYKKNILF